MNLSVKNAYAVTAAFALSLAFTSAHAEPPKIDFDKGVDTAQVLEAIRHQNLIIAIDTNTLPAIQWAKAKSTAPLKGPITDIDTVARVKNSAPYEASVQYPPLIALLEPAERAPLEAEWRIINRERASLLAEADAFENEEWTLYDRAVAIDRNAERLNDRADKLSTEIDNFNRQCTGRPLPPGEYNACLRWKNDLERRLGEHEAEVTQHNAAVDQWRREAADLRNRVGTTGSNTRPSKNISFMRRVAAWEQGKINPFIDRASQAIQRGRITRVTIEAQGENPPVQKSVKLVTKDTVCKETGEGMLGELLAQLTDSERDERDEAFVKAYEWIRSRPAAGESAPPPVRKTFQNTNRRDPQARVDINIWAGTAFVTCPCCSK